MKKLLVLGMALILMTNAFADDDTSKKTKRNHDRGTEMHEHRRGDFSQLNLTEDQKVKMKTLRENHRTEMQSMREKHRLDLKGVMTAEQWTKFEQMKAQRPKAANRRGEKRVDGPEHEKKH